MMIGIHNFPATSASLVLNFEVVFTVLFAWFVFKEKVDKQVLFGMITIMLGGVALSLGDSEQGAISFGAFFVILACFCWALDNNFARKISASDPIEITAFKGVIAGAVNMIIGYFYSAETQLPNLAQIAKISVIGFFSYGVCFVFIVKSLNLIGAARTGTYFGIAPFIGALMSVIILSEPITTNLIISAFLMGLGMWICAAKDEHD